MVTSDYAFVRYRMAAQLVRAKVNTVAMKRYEHDTIRLAKAAGRDTALLFVDNPCNPTGTMIQKRAFERMLAAVPEKTIVVADEAYYEFARADPKYPDTLKLRAKHPNLMVTRTFSKAYGLAGLRIGYGVARREIVDDLNRVRAPFNANRMAQAAALAALDDRTHLRRVVQTNERGKTFLAKTFKRLGIGYTPTWANFFLVDFAPVGRTGKEAYDRLLPRGVIVRPMNGYGLASSVRISIGTPEQNQKLAMLLSEWLRP
jgi:histidinol-phosphate aminotransferase